MFALACLTSILAGVTAAAAAEPRPGRYFAQGGTGDLLISKSQAGLRFSIDAVGANGHTCSLEGSLEGTEGRTEATDDGVCRVAIAPMEDGYDVEALTQAACRNWCGMRGQFEYSYRPMPAQCAEPRYKARQAEFLSHYKAKRYEAALATATKLRDECSHLRWFPDVDALANDIAITLYHLGRPQECLEAISKTVAYDYRSPEDAELPPVEYESYLPVAKATITNRGLCQKKLGKR